MKKRLKRVFLKEKKFRKEFRRQLRMIIIVTLGFTIAFTWRQTIFDLSLAAVQFFTQIDNSSTLSILTSTLITILSLIIIYFTSDYLKDSFE